MAASVQSYGPGQERGCILRDMPDAPASLDRLATLLFVPADRLERIAKAIASGADAVIIDLEDAVVPQARETARTALYRYPRPSNGSGVPLILRISAVGTPDHESDVAVAQALPTRSTA